VVSVDTYKASVARAAVELGAEVVNDVSGFRWDPKMAKTLAELKVGAVLMHTRGRPEEWRSLPPIGDPVLIVKRDLRQWAERRPLGIKRDHLVLDPGFGFGKRFEENYPLLAHFDEVAADGISAAGRSVAEVIYRANAGARWQGRGGARAALRDAGCGNRADPERSAHHPDARCALCSGGGEGRGRDCG
jgi:dihydropteroate synthase